MKHFFVFLMLASMFSNFALAIETTTDCPMMRESNERNNPKAALSSQKPKSGSKSGASAQ